MGRFRPSVEPKPLRSWRIAQDETQRRSSKFGEVGQTPSQAARHACSHAFSPVRLRRELPTLYWTRLRAVQSRRKRLSARSRGVHTRTTRQLKHSLAESRSKICDSTTSLRGVDGNERIARARSGRAGKQVPDQASRTDWSHGSRAKAENTIGKACVNLNSVKHSDVGLPRSF